MLQLDPMTQEEYLQYLATAIHQYARDTARGWKRPLEETQANAQKDYDQLLPQGLATPNNFLFTARESGERVGMVWIAITERPTGKSAYIYNIQIDEARRGKGLGRQLLAAAERKAADQGANRIGLNVFGFNTTARTLYESAGFEIAAINMIKPL
jgi:ribosomal protein S18 acetylase RimI-like enzyme